MDQLIPLGSIEPAGGRLAVCDPFLLVEADLPEPLPGALPAGRHEVAVALVADPDGGARVETAYLFVGDGEPEEWESVGAVPADSGVLCFGTPEAVRGLAEERTTTLDDLDRALTANGAQTWEHAKLDGLVAFSSGFGDGLFEVFWGYDADERLAAVAVECLAEEELEAERPGPGLQHAFLLAAALGGEPVPENVVPVPPQMNRQLTTTERAIVRTLLGGKEVEFEVTPVYEGESRVPAHVEIKLQ